MKVMIIAIGIIAACKATAIADGITQTIAVITNATPSGWQIAHVELVKPAWVRSDDKCTEILLYGPRLQGFAYYGESEMKGQLIAEWRYANEALLVWITPEGYRSGWNAANKLLNFLSPFTVNLPTRIDHNRKIRVYAQQSTYIPPENEYLHKHSPEGTKSAAPIGPTNGYSWVNWKSDLTTALEKNLPTRQSRVPLPADGSRSPHR